jgi:hypothetical protein
MLREIWRRSLISRKPSWIAPLAASVAIILVASNLAAAEALSPQQQLAFDIYKELVEINTVTATGDTAGGRGDGGAAQDRRPCGG